MNYYEVFSLKIQFNFRSLTNVSRWTENVEQAQNLKAQIENSIKVFGSYSRIQQCSVRVLKHNHDVCVFFFFFGNLQFQSNEERAKF